MNAPLQKYVYLEGLVILRGEVKGNWKGLYPFTNHINFGEYIPSRRLPAQS